MRKESKFKDLSEGEVANLCAQPQKKFRVTETNTTIYVYECEAENECEAEDKVRTGEAEHLSEYDSHVEKTFEFEEIK